MRFKYFIIVLIFSIFGLYLSGLKVEAAVTANQMVDEYPVVSTVNNSGDMVTRMRNNISKLLKDNTHRGYPGAQLAEQTNRLMWYKGMEIYTLSATIPYLDTATQTSLKTFLQYEVNSYLLNSSYNSFERSGDMATKIPNSHLKWTYNDATVGETLYGLWAYAYYTNDWTTIQTNWSKIQTLYSQVSNSPSIILGGTDLPNFIYSINSEMAGRIAYARLAKKLYSITNTTSYNTTYQSTITTVANRLPALSTQMSYGFFDGQKCGNVTYVISCGRGILLDLPEFHFLTPELARYMKDQYTTQVSSVISTTETTYPWWHLGSYMMVSVDDNNTYNTGAGWEGYYVPPIFSYEIYQAKSEILNTSTAELRKRLPWVNEFASVPNYWDVYYYSNLQSLIRASETTNWVDTNIPAPTANIATITSTTSPTPIPCTLKASGDANCDGKTDLLDFEVWRQEFNTILNTLLADFNNDNATNLTDFNIWRGIFAPPITPTITPTPIAATITPTRTPTPTLIPTLTLTPTLTPTANGTPTPTPTIEITKFAIGAGGSDVIPHQIIRTNTDRVYIFGYAGDISSTLVGHWTTSGGIPTAGTQFNGSIQYTEAAVIISVNPVYDGANTIHIFMNLNNGALIDQPFNITTNTFSSIISLASGSPTVSSGGLVGTSGVSAMIDTSNTIHVAYWSSGNHITYVGYTYNASTNSLTTVRGPTQLDSAGNANHPSLAISPKDGSLLVAWVSEATTPKKILARSYASGTWGSIDTLSTAPVWTSTVAGINIDQGPSIVIDNQGNKYLVYIEDYDATTNYGRVHFVSNTGSGWVDQATQGYSHDPALAINSAGSLFIIGHGGGVSATCLSTDYMCYMKRNSDGTWTNQLLVASPPTGYRSFDTSPSVKWSVIGFNRSDVVEFIFPALTTNGGYNNTNLFYASIQ